MHSRTSPPPPAPVGPFGGATIKVLRQKTEIILMEREILRSPLGRERYNKLCQLVNLLWSLSDKLLKVPPLPTSAMADFYEEDKAKLGEIDRGLSELPPPISRNVRWDPKNSADGSIHYQMGTAGERSISRFAREDLVDGSRLALSLRDDNAYHRAELLPWSYYRRLRSIVGRYGNNPMDIDASFYLENEQYGEDSAQREIEKVAHRRGERSDAIDVNEEPPALPAPESDDSSEESGGGE
jgi:hypothetical protein